MANANLVTGYRGEPHVSSADEGKFNSDIVGSGKYVFDVGSKLATTVVSATEVTVADGDLSINGRYVRVESTVSLSLENGSQGMKRSDLIACRYTKNQSTGKEEANIVLIPGTASSGTPSDPTNYGSKNVLSNHNTVDFLLYRVNIDGLTITSITKLFTLKGGIPTIHELTSNPSDSFGSNGDYAFIKKSRVNA